MDKSNNDLVKILSSTVKDRHSYPSVWANECIKLLDKFRHNVIETRGNIVRNKTKKVENSENHRLDIRFSSFIKKLESSEEHFINIGPSNGKI